MDQLANVLNKDGQPKPNHYAGESKADATHLRRSKEERKSLLRRDFRCIASKSNRNKEGGGGGTTVRVLVSADSVLTREWEGGKIMALLTERRRSNVSAHLSSELARR